MSWKQKLLEVIKNDYKVYTLENYAYYQNPISEKVPFYVYYDINHNVILEKYIVNNGIISTKFNRYINNKLIQSVIHLENKSYSILRDYRSLRDYYIRESYLGWVSADIKPNLIQYSENYKILSVDHINEKFNI